MQLWEQERLRSVWCSCRDKSTFVTLISPGFTDPCWGSRWRTRPEASNRSQLCSGIMSDPHNIMSMNLFGSAVLRHSIFNHRIKEQKQLCFCKIGLNVFSAPNIDKVSKCETQEQKMMIWIQQEQKLKHVIIDNFLQDAFIPSIYLI